jgi:hypothetical protein
MVRPSRRATSCWRPDRTRGRKDLWAHPAAALPRLPQARAASRRRRARGRLVAAPGIPARRGGGRGGEAPVAGRAVRPQPDRVRPGRRPQHRLVRTGHQHRARPRRAEIGSVVWATRYRLDFGWVDLPVFDESGYPRHTRGVTTHPGLYAVGLPWLHSLASSVLPESAPTPRMSWSTPSAGAPVSARHDSGMVTGTPAWSCRGCGTEQRRLGNSTSRTPCTTCQHRALGVCTIPVSAGSKV